MRTAQLRDGLSLSTVTASLARRLGVAVTVAPISDDPVRTRVLTAERGWMDFQEYFVIRRNEDQVEALEYVGAKDATPAPGVVEAIESAELVVIAPSNPPLSIWPMLAVPGIREALEAHHRVVAVSPLIEGKALKGPAARVMATLGLPPGNRGVAAAYEGLIDRLVVHSTDVADADVLDVEVTATDTLIREPEAAARLATELLDLP